MLVVIIIVSFVSLMILPQPEQIVVYESLGPKRTVWTRPYDLFNALNTEEDAVQKYRFEQIDDYIDMED